MLWEHDFLIFLQENMRSGLMDGLMKGVSFLANGGWFFLVIGLGLIFYPKTRSLGITVIVGLIMHLIVVNLGLKPFVGRMRPYDRYADLLPLSKRISDYSFPSGHTAATFTTATVFLRQGKLEGIKRARLGAAALFALGILIGFSRMYLGVHYPTDVLAGAAAGVLCGCLGVWVRNTRLFF